MSSEIPTEQAKTALPGYFDNYAERKAKGYGPLLFKTGKGLQSNELMALQHHFLDRLSGIADGVYNNGDVLEGLQPSILIGNDAGNLRVAEGRIYIAGAVHDLGTSTLTIPLTQKVAIGLRVFTSIVTDEDDSLLKDPAIGYDNFAEPGAGTVKTELLWGWQAADGTSDDPDSEGQFYPVYDVDSGNIIIKDVTPGIDAINAVVGSYDYTAHGNYTIDGFKVRFAKFEAANAQHSSDQYIFTISNGTVHVRGRELKRSVDTPLVVDIDFDTATSTAESETYVPNAGTYVLTLNRAPLAVLQEITGLVQLTETVTKGSTGGQDLLVNSSVEYLIEVSKGATIYQQGRDYLLVDGKVDWSPSGVGAIEPGVGDDYTVKCAVRENLLTNGRGNIVGTTYQTITLTGLVPNTLSTPSIVYVTYTYKLQRVDAITIDGNADFHRIRGRSSFLNPSSPPIPDTHTKLALIIFDWSNDPEVRDIRTLPTSFDELVKIKQRQDDLYDLVALSRLQNDLTAREPADRRGQFVDAFFDNDQRNQTLPNDMAILSGLLMLPITAEAQPPDNYGNSLRHHLLPYQHEIVILQDKYTACTKINPYQAFEPIPARATISPPFDNWVISASAWNTPIVTNFVRVTIDANQNATPAANNLNVPSSVVQTVVIAGQTIRPQPISFLIEGFGPGEALVQIRFDDIVFSNTIVGALPFTVSGVADANGTLTGSFTLPAGIPTGEKAVEFFGNSSYGDCTFIGASEISYPVILRQGTRSGRRRKKKRCDPVAQTFTLDEDRILTGADVKFCKRGNGPQIVYLQLRETTVGIPQTDVIAEGIFDMSTLAVDGNGVPYNEWTRILFEIPALVLGGKGYSFVLMTDDADHSVALAGLGEYMTPGLNGGLAGFVTGQPYQGGEMLSSSNGETWTPHPKQDLTFRLLAAKFTTNQSVIDLGNISVTNVSDLVARATVLRPSAACDVRFRFTPDSVGAVYESPEESPLTLPLRLNGSVKVEAVITGNIVDNPNLSPILYARPQVIKGVISNTGNYISRRFNARNPITLENEFTVVCVFEYRKQTGMSVVPKVLSQVLDGGGLPVFSGGLPVTEWRDMELHLEKVLSDGWYEADWRLPATPPPGVAQEAYAVAPDYTTVVQLYANGSPASRVYVRNLRTTTKS